MANFNDRIRIFHCWRHEFTNFTNCPDDWEALVLTDYRHAYPPRSRGGIVS